MKILVTFGSERGGTAEIASQIAKSLGAAGHDATVTPAREVRDPARYDAVLVGGALYAGRWHGEARRFVLRHVQTLRRLPVWFFSSGPLDDSARDGTIAPTAQVQQLMDFVGARGHATFGGRLAPDAHGFIAAKMARTHSGDWRDPVAIAAWARSIAAQLALDFARADRGVAAQRSFKPLPSRAVPVALGLFTGLSALFGGAALVARPDGSLLRMPLSMLEHSPFHDFLIPGVLLFAIVGSIHLWAAGLQLARSDFAALATFFAGGALTVWTLVEMILLRSAHPLQLGYLLIGLVLMGEAIRQGRTMFQPPTTSQPSPTPG